MANLDWMLVESTNDFQLLISKKIFGFGFIFILFYETSNLIFRLIIWISKTFGSYCFHKKVKDNLV